MSRSGGNQDAQIRLGNQRWSLAPGQALTFGRGRDRDIRFAHEPEDDYVSRQAGALEALFDGVLVRNNSRTQSLVLRPFPGSEIVIAPQGVVGTMPHDRLQLVVPGRHGARYVLMIDTRRKPPSQASATDDDTGSVMVSRTVKPTRSGAAKITSRELRMLSALCEPLLIFAGPAAVPATYRQIALRLDVTGASVKNCLALLRARLSDEDGIPGLRANEEDDENEGDESPSSYLAALAAWAVHAQVITVSDLAILDPPVLDAD